MSMGRPFPRREGTPAAHQLPARPRPVVGGICAADTKPSGRGGAGASVAEVTTLVFDTPLQPCREQAPVVGRLQGLPAGLRMAERTTGACRMVRARCRDEGQR